MVAVTAAKTDAAKPTVVEALSRVMADVQAVGKGSTNQQQGYRFRGIDAVINAVGPAFRQHGVLCLPTVEEVAYNVVEVGKQRTLMRECTVRVRYTFYGPGGDTLDCVAIGEAMDSGDKSTPKAMSVAYRVALLQALCIPTDEPDADAQTYERAARTEVERAEQRAQERSWDPIEQDVLRAGWEAEIADAEDTAAITEIGKRVLAQKKSGELSPATVDRITKAASARKAELNGGGDHGSAGDRQPALVP